MNARCFSNDGKSCRCVRAYGDAVAFRPVAPLIIHRAARCQSRGLSGTYILACHGHDWRWGIHWTTVREIEVNDILHGLFAQGTVRRIVLRLPEIVPARPIIRIAACWNTAAKKGIGVGQKLRIVGWKNGFVMRQSVANQF